MSTHPTALLSAPASDLAYIDNWDEYWLEMAYTAGRKSKDPKCRVGAVVVRENVVLSTGFNGFARQVFDDPSLLLDPEEKLRLICHAEQNAIHNAGRFGIALAGATIYVTKFPCLACTNAIIQSGIVSVYTHDKKFWDDDPADRDHSRKKSALRQARVKVEAPFHPDYAPRLVRGKPAAVPVVAPTPSFGSDEGRTKPKAKGLARTKGKSSMPLFPGKESGDKGGRT